MNETLVVIPNAGTVSDSIIPLSRKKSPAMIDIGGKPLVFHQLEYLISLGFRRFTICLSRGDSIARTFISAVFGSKVDISFSTPDRNRGVGYTIWHAIKDKSAEKLFIVLGDTIFSFNKELKGEIGTPEIKESFVMTAQLDKEDPSRWCVVETDKYGQITDFYDKQPEYTGNGQILAGIYAFSDFSAAQNAFSSAWCEIEQTDLPFEIAPALSKYMEKLPLFAAPLIEWYDFGNIDLLINSRKKILKQRAFNALSIDTNKGIIRKSSPGHSEKLTDEINYLRLLPNNLKIFFPRILEFDLFDKVPIITMEYYGYPTLSELFVFEQMHATLWRMIFEHLYFAIEEFLQYKPHIPALSIQENFGIMYKKRIVERIEKIQNASWGVSVLLRSEELTVNGKRLKNFFQIWEDIQEKIALLMRNDDYSVIHGDLCFPNILCDVANDVLKYIDPRGSFGEKGIFGDIKYDVAKLYHSVHGEYDFIVNDLFSIEFHDDSTITFEIYNYNRYVLDEFRSIFFNKGRFIENEIKLIEGLLFISMPVFHYDNPKRQIAMYLRGLQILNEL